MKLEDLRKLGDEATKGPWLREGSHLLTRNGIFVGSDEYGPVLCVNDAEFIAAARNHWDALLGVVQEAKNYHERVEAIDMGLRPVEGYAYWLKRLRSAFDALESVGEGGDET